MPLFKSLPWRMSRAAALNLVCAAGLAMVGSFARAQTAELDALNLQAEPAKEDKPRAAPGTRVFVEAALGRADQRYGLAGIDARRLSLDANAARRLTPQWRGVVSYRLDVLHPQTGDRAIHTLREAYLGWQDSEALWAFEAGRINLRTGPGFGFNPSDFFRAGARRVTTTIDPIALRENRQGTLAMRVQRAWTGGALSAVVAPKFGKQPSTQGFSLDAGRSNPAGRVQLAWSQTLADGVSAQLIGLKETGRSASLGANFSALLSDALVLHGEWSTGSEPNGTNQVRRTRAERGVLGLTWAGPAKWSLTAEFQYNQAAPGPNGWQSLLASGGIPALASYLATADALQDLAPRRAAFFYLSKQDLGWRGLNLTALVRRNLEDDSHILWLELRRAWAQWELALQAQFHEGDALTEFGVLPVRRSVQVLGTYRF
jgi:hypothetical protein